MNIIYLPYKKLIFNLLKDFFCSKILLFFVLTFSSANIVRGQLTASWNGPTGLISIQSGKTYFVVDWLDTVTMATVQGFVANSGYALHLPDTDDILIPRIHNRTKIRFDISSGPISDSTYIQCFRYFRDSLGPEVKAVFSTFDEQGQIFEETEWVIVRIKNYTDTSSLRIWAASNGYLIRNEALYSRVFLLERISSNINGIASGAFLLSLNSWVEFAEPLYNIHGIQSFIPNDSYYGDQWYLKNTGSNCPLSSTTCSAGADIKMEEGWDQRKGCDKIKIGVSDDGIQINHADLMCDSGYNCYYESPMFSTMWTANVKPWDRAFFLNKGNRYVPNKDGTHGTLCGGIVGAKTNNNIGIAGVGYGISIEPYKIVTNSGANPLILAATYKYGVDSGNVDVMSCSWAISMPYSIIALSIDYAISNGRNGLGMAIVHSTGNTMDDPCSAYGIRFPASYEPVIATTGSTSCDKLKTCSGDCSGETDWGAYYGPGTDLAAPCHGILTTDIESAAGRSSGDYFGFNGTSSSVPQVAGLLGLIYSANPFLTLEQARHSLESTCDKVGGYTYTVNSNQPNGTWSEELGYGRINSENAIESAKSKKTILYFSQMNTVTKLNSSSSFLFNPTIGPYELKMICPSDRILSQNYNVTWFRNGIQIASGTNLYSLINPKPGRYTAIVNITCPNSAVIFSDEVELKYQCNAIGYDMTFENGMVISNAFNLINTTPVVYYIGSDIEVTASGNFQITNCKLVFSNCAKLIVNNGTLIANNCEFVSCDKWSGIYQDYSNSYVTLTNCLVEDATVGYSKNGEGTMALYSTEFGINYIHSIVENSIPTSVHTINVSNNKFGKLLDNNNLNLACPFYFSNYAAYPFRNNTYLSIYNSTNTNIIGNQFYSYENSFELTAYYSNNLYSQQFNANLFYGFFDTATVFRTCEMGYITNNEYLKDLNAWTINYPVQGKIGVFAYNSKSLNINSNTFTHLQRGIEYYSRRIGTTNIKYNVFNFSDYGLITATDENPVLSTFPYKNAPSGVLVDVQTRCNEFYDCKYGWVGTGKYNTQGTASTATGNKFFNTGFWNVLVAASSGTFYYSPNGNASENPYNYLIGSLNMDGINYNNVNYGTQCFLSQNGTANSCNGSSPSTSIRDESNTNSIFIFPNPFSEKLSIQFDKEIDNIQISDVSGRIEIEYSNIHETSITIATPDLNVGSKLVRVVFKDGHTITFKAVKY